jgi:hypothetical protein
VPGSCTVVVLGVADWRERGLEVNPVAPHGFRVRVQALTDQGGRSAMSANDGDTARALCGQWMPRKKTKGRYHAAEGWERCRVRVRAWCTIEMTSAMLIGTESAVAMFIPAMCLVVEMPSK